MQAAEKFKAFTSNACTYSHHSVPNVPALHDMDPGVGPVTPSADLFVSSAALPPGRARSNIQSDLAGGMTHAVCTFVHAS